VFTVGAEYNQLAPITSDSPLVVPLAGNVSDVGIWTNPLGSDEVAALYHSGVPADALRNAGSYVSSATLSHYWRLDDGSGNVARDSKGKQPGHVVNGAVWSTETPSRSPAVAVSRVRAPADPVRILRVAGDADDPPRDRAPAAGLDVGAVRNLVATVCPSGQTLVTVAEAVANREAVCAKLGRWDIVRLAGGGSMDGPGYHCGTRDVDDRSLGGVLCKPGAGPTSIGR
jgi:hypothetical protein